MSSLQSAEVEGEARRKEGEVPMTKWVLRMLFAFALLALAGIARPEYPDKPIRFIVSGSPGGSPDVLMRILTAELSQRLGQPIVILNKPGANAVIGTMEIVRAPPDGYTLGYGNIVSLAINQGLLPNLPYDVERDLTLISNCLRVANLLAVNNDLPVKSVGQLIAHAKEHPGTLAFASPGNGTTGHLGGELFKTMAGVDMLHVPYRGGPQAITDLIAGQAQVIFDNITSVAPHVKAGRLRPLGVSGPRRSVLFPNVPTIAESGLPGYETVAWGGVIGPANMPTAIVEKLHREIVASLQSPAVRQRFAELGTDPDGSSPQQFQDLVKRERPRWAAVIKKAGAKID
ncbi:MAG: tripartite tricarboxylate transporter substrate binding protein [Burkholderiales bacterium]